MLASPKENGDLLTPSHDKQDPFIEELLPDDFINNKENLKRMPLLETIDKICSIFNIERLNEQGAYLCAFYDKVADLQQTIPATLTNSSKPGTATFAALPYKATAYPGCA